MSLIVPKSHIKLEEEFSFDTLSENLWDKKICFVCTGNTCRSPMAEGIARAITKSNHLPLEITSAGTYAENGSPAARNAVCALDEMGIELSSHRSKNLLDVNTLGSLFVCMTRGHMDDAAGAGIPAGLITLLGEGILDPYGGSLDVYRECRNSIAGAVTQLLKTLADELPIDKHVFIRECHAVDAWALAGLENECFSEPWSAYGFLSSMAMGDTIFLAAVSGGKMIGYIGMQHTDDTGYTTNLCVSEGHRRKGIAKKLISELLQKAKEMGEREVTLEVRPSNTPAVNLYESMGFIQTGLRKNFYRHPNEDGAIYQFTIHNS